MALQQEVLALYRCIFRLARKWTSLSGMAQDTREEQEYIRTEAKTLFKKNKKITDESQIRQHIKEAEARIEIAQHYRIPYPRPHKIGYTWQPVLMERTTNPQAATGNLSHIPTLAESEMQTNADRGKYSTECSSTNKCKTQEEAKATN